MKKFLLIFIPLFCFYSCKDTQNYSALSITDDLGNKFDFNKTPSRIISLAPSITESFYYLGLDSMLVGVTEYCDFPEQAKTKTSIGGMLDPNLEIITKLNPDLIFLTTEGNSQITYKSLKDLGFRVFVLNPKNVNGIVTSMEKICSIFKNIISDNKLNEFKAELNTLTNDSIRRPFAGFLALKPLITFNKNTFLNDVFKKSGFRNLYEDENLDYPSISEEDLFSKDPDYLFIFSADSNKDIVSKEVENKYGRLKSVHRKSYFILDENVFTRPGPRVINSIKKLKSL